MSGKSILVVGARGTGKTTTNKSMVSKVHPSARLVLDVNGEYRDLYPYDFIGFDQFTERMTQVKDCFIVVEEATIYLNNRGHNSNITDALVKARHNNNTVLFSFHSLRSIPKYIFDLSNMIILHKTGDNEDIIEEFRNPKLSIAFSEIKKAPMLKSKTGVEYSPRKIIKLY